METLQGELEHVIFRNEENGYAVCRLRVKNRRKPVVIVGTVAALPGESVSAKGHWVDDKKYGPQFKVAEYQSVVPATINAIERYLASGLIKGIGPIYAKRLVERFGLQTLDVIEKSPDRLGEIDGIGPVRKEKICAAWEAQKEIKSIMLFLQGHGVSTTYAARIYKEYGQQAIRVVKEDPYRLARDIVGIGFIKADRIARNLGITEDSPLRARAGLLFALNQAADEGHVFLPESDLTGKAAELLKIAPPILSEALRFLIENGQLILEPDLTVHASPLTPHGLSAVYLPPFHVSEKGIASRLTTLLKSPSLIRTIDVPKAIDWVEERTGFQFAEGQRRAVAHAVSEKGVIITGGPGTGKTTIVRAIASIYLARKARILLAAPTGRAAKRLSEATHLPAQTIHRMLGFSPKGGFQHNADRPLEADVVIIDEVSMVDTLLMYHLLKAVPDHATVILVGDAHQLPSVGPGQVLADLILSGILPTITLTEIFRQAQRSLIVRNAHRIHEGEFPYLQPLTDQAKDDFFYLEEEEPEKVVAAIQTLIAETLPRRFRLNPFEDIQLLCPMNRGIAGVENLNRVLQATLNPEGTEVQRAGRTFRQGDKVMQIANNYNKGVFNGDIGRIRRIDLEEQELAVAFDHAEVPYEFSELDELVLAYAVSVHKSQGSEYPAVILPVLTQHYLLLQRNLLYTAVTRGKRLLVLIGTKKALAMAIRNNPTLKRHTLLAQRLRENLPQAECGMRNADFGI